MRASFALVVFAAVASASSLGRRQGQLPPCAQQCISIADPGSCRSDDTACMCKSQSFVNSVSKCLQGSCTGKDFDAAVKGAQDLCAAAGVTLVTIGLSAPTSASAATATATSPAPSTSASFTMGSDSWTPLRNSAMVFSVASPMVGALAAMGGLVFAL